MGIDNDDILEIIFDEETKEIKVQNSIRLRTFLVEK